MNKYIVCFEKARDKYLSQAERVGYPRGYFTWFRHGANTYKLKELECSLRTKDTESARQLIEEHFSTSEKVNNHSFNVYFLDELLSDFPEENWQRCNSKPIVFYTGKLYLGTSLRPAYVFKEGISEAVSSDSIEDYISNDDKRPGIYTTKYFSIMENNGLINTRENGARNIFDIRYVYEVDYRGCEAIDLEATYSLRKEIANSLLARSKQTVNVIAAIKACDIVKAWKYGMYSIATAANVEIKNPDYQTNREVDFKGKLNAASFNSSFRT